MKGRYILVWSPTKYVSPNEWAEGSLWLYGSLNPNSALRTPYVYVGASIPLFPYLVSFDELYNEAVEVIFPNYLGGEEGNVGKFRISREEFPRIVRTWDAHEGILAFRFDSLKVFEGIPVERRIPEEELSWSPLMRLILEIDDVYLEALSEEENIVDEIARMEIVGEEGIKSERPKEYVRRVKRYMEGVRQFVRTYKERKIKVKTPEPEMDIRLKRYLKEMFSDIYGVAGEEAWKEYMNYIVPYRTREHYGGRLEYFLGSICAHYWGMKEIVKKLGREYGIIDFRGAFLNLLREIRRDPYSNFETEMPGGPYRIEAVLLGRVFPVILRDYLMLDHRESIYWAKQILSALAIRKCKEAYRSSYEEFKEKYYSCLEILASI